MSKIKTAISLLQEPLKCLLPLADRGYLDWMNDEMYLKLAYKAFTGRRLNLYSPKLFTEKLQWLKIYDRNEKYIDLVDKIKVKEYVSSKIGSTYVIPTIGVWDCANDIDIQKLPKQFVLKCNHDSGSVIICKNKSKFDIDDAKKRLTHNIRKNSYSWGREWPYKFVKRYIIAEEYLETKDSNSADLIDYKFYCFNGKPIYCQVITNRSTSEGIDFYDMNWVHQPFVGLTPNVKNSGIDILKPYNFEKMKDFSEILSEGMVFCRVDYYEVDKKMYFGEITLYPTAGFGVFTPEEWDYKLGQILSLPDKH